MRYIVIDETRGNEYTEEFNTKNEAIKYADEMWNCKCAADQKNCTAYYVLESINPDEEAENHFDGNVVKEYK